jgi:ppGpp synthetase/RelA/SpoT-type nucleotidyltranferase
MSVTRKNVILSEYRAKRAIYEEFSSTCEDLIRRLLELDGIRYHSVTSRTKDIYRLAEKLIRPGKQYKKLTDITDLSGVRVITYFADDVDAVASLIEREFKVFQDHSIDKRKALDPDRFGYLSLHYVCALSDARLRLSEYSAFQGYMCEIQVRSILQHAWAEIEHDLGYTVPRGIPRLIRRRFSRLASLLETGDEEFMKIREELNAYIVSVKEQIPASPSTVLLDRVSVKAFLEHDVNIQELEQKLANYVHADLEEITDELADMRVKELNYVGLNNIAEVQSAVKEKANTVLKLFKFKIVLKGKRYPSLYRGIGLFNLVQVLLGERGDLPTVVTALNELKVGWDRDRARFAKQLIELVHQPPSVK